MKKASPPLPCGIELPQVDFILDVMLQAAETHSNATACMESKQSKPSPHRATETPPPMPQV